MNILPAYQYLLSVCRTSLFAGGFDPKKGSEVWARTADELSPCVSYFNATHRTKIKSIRADNGRLDDTAPVVPESWASLNF